MSVPVGDTTVPEPATAAQADLLVAGGDVVTMNSEVLVRDLDSKKEMTVTLVFPSEADLEQGKISILAPVGTALLGYRVGDTIEWKVPGRVRRLRVEKVLYQPEAAGDYHR